MELPQEKQYLIQNRARAKKRASDLSGSVVQKSLLQNMDPVPYLNKGKYYEQEKNWLKASTYYRKAVICRSEEAKNRLFALYENGSLPCDEDNKPLKDVLVAENKSKLHNTSIVNVTFFHLLFDTAHKISKAETYLKILKENFLIFFPRGAYKSHKIARALFDIGKHNLDELFYHSVALASNSPGRPEIFFAAEKLLEKGADFNSEFNIAKANVHFNDNNPFARSFLSEFVKKNINFSLMHNLLSSCDEEYLYFFLNHGAEVTNKAVKLCAKSPQKLVILTAYCYDVDDFDLESENSLINFCFRLIDSRSNEIENEVKKIVKSDEHNDRQLCQRPGFELLLSHFNLLDENHKQDTNDPIEDLSTNSKKAEIIPQESRSIRTDSPDKSTKEILALVQSSLDSKSANLLQKDNTFFPYLKILINDVKAIKKDEQHRKAVNKIAEKTQVFREDCLNTLEGLLSSTDIKSVHGRLSIFYGLSIIINILDDIPALIDQVKDKITDCLKAKIKLSHTCEDMNVFAVEIIGYLYLAKEKNLVLPIKELQAALFKNRVRVIDRIMLEFELEFQNAHPDCPYPFSQEFQTFMHEVLTELKAKREIPDKQIFNIKTCERKDKQEQSGDIHSTKRTTSTRPVNSTKESSISYVEFSNIVNKYNTEDNIFDDSPEMEAIKNLLDNKRDITRKDIQTAISDLPWHSFIRSKSHRLGLFLGKPGVKNEGYQTDNLIEELSQQFQVKRGL